MRVGDDFGPGGALLLLSLQQGPEDGQWTAVPDAESMARSNDAYARAQREAGMAGGEVLALACEDLGPDAAMVRGRFSRLRADGSRLADVAASYLVVRVGGDAAGPAAWKVAVCLMGR